MKIQILVVFAACSLVQCIPDLSAMCTQIEQINCLFEYVADGSETVCASNNQTYQNFCFYSQVRCVLPDIHVVGVGSCRDYYRRTTPATPATTTMSTTMQVVTLTSKPPVVTTTAPTTAVTTATEKMTTPGVVMSTIDHVKETFCASKDTVACPTDLDPICASDKTFYLNKCEFSKATCTNPSLVIKGISFCTGV